MSKKIFAFLRGMGSVLVIFPKHRRFSASDNRGRSPSESLARDWEKVSSDFRRGFDLVKKEVEPREKQDA